jgi:hypothetical protein
VDTLTFFRKVLPASGYYVIGRICPGQTWFTHTVCSTLEEATQFALAYDGGDALVGGVPTYHACAAYREEFIEEVGQDGKVKKKVRVHKNVRAVKAFWMDLDVKAGDPLKYQSQEEALDGLLAFCDSTGLPLPMVINSGYGIHIYWPLDDEISHDVFRQTAEALKALAINSGLKADHACTADPARVLRPVGTHNRKVPSDPRAVELVADCDPIPFATLKDLISAALKIAGVKAPDAIRGAAKGADRLNEAFAVQQSFAPSSAKKIADKCAQLALMRDTKGVIAEPHWYAGIQLMCHTTEGDELIHEWSSGHSSYTRDETDRKIQQIRGQSMGPTTCATFDSRNPGKCENCPFYKKQTSPIQLGVVIERAAPPKIMMAMGDGSAPVEVTLPNAPAPFERNKNGGIYCEIDGISHKVYDYDLFPIALESDESLGYDTIRIKHHLPQEGWQEFSVRAGLISTPSEFEKALRDCGVMPDDPKRIIMYIHSYAKAIQAVNKRRVLAKSQGWKEDGSFVLGNKLFSPDGKCYVAGIAGSSKEYLDNFHSKGSLDLWKEQTNFLNDDRMNPHAFMLGVGFSAPLLKLSQMSGFMISALGDTNAGKSTMAKWMMSIWGNKHTFVPRNGTQNALIARLGALNSLPAYIDEITTIEPKQMREIAYMITNGVGRDKSTVKGGNQKIEKWDTVLVATTNDSVHGKLALEKPNADAESMRVFEFRFPNVPEFEKAARGIHHVIEDNYGLAGERFIHCLVMNRQRIIDELRDYMIKFEREAGALGKERFWTQGVALAIYGLELAVELELIDFDVAPVKAWAIKEMARVRTNVAASQYDASEVISEYLSATYGEMLVVSKLAMGQAANKLPHGKLSARYEADTNTIWTITAPLAKWLADRHYNVERIRDELYAKKILLDHNCKKVLTAGLTGMGSAQPRCWKLDASKLSLEEAS